MRRSDSDDPAVCVVITAYRQPGLLPESVASVLRQNPRCRIVIVNDGCPYPETHEFCVRAREAYPDYIRYIRQRNGGPGAARNAAIELALRIWPNFSAMFFLDGDNRLGISTLRQMYDSMVRQDSDWVFSDLHLIGSNALVGMAGEYCVLRAYAAQLCRYR
jgi:glycosyltransferase involved in cell wall biosynthesis